MTAELNHKSMMRVAFSTPSIKETGSPSPIDSSSIAFCVEKCLSHLLTPSQFAMLEISNIVHGVEKIQRDSCK